MSGHSLPKVSSRAARVLLGRSDCGSFSKANRYRESKMDRELRGSEIHCRISHRVVPKMSAAALVKMPAPWVLKASTAEAAKAGSASALCVSRFTLYDGPKISWSWEKLWKLLCLRACVHVSTYPHVLANAWAIYNNGDVEFAKFGTRANSGYHKKLWRAELILRITPRFENVKDWHLLLRQIV